MTARAHGELHKILLQRLFLTMFQPPVDLSRNPDYVPSYDSDGNYLPSRKSTLNGWQGQVERTIRETSFPPQTENADGIRETEELRGMMLLFAREFFAELSGLALQDRSVDSKESE